MNRSQSERQNQQYRSNSEPSALHQAAFEDALQTGDVAEEAAQEMVDRLYDPWPGGNKETPRDPTESTLPNADGNGLSKAVVRHDHSIAVHISEKLYQQQPIGVLLRPVNEAVRQAGEALITDVTPRSVDVEADVMPATHYKLTITPTPIWLTWWVGENGYPLI